jgi:hypothetical protein
MEGSRIGRLAAEFTVIVIGVLVALVLESWWSEREERRFESEIRADLVDEFRQNLDILASDQEANARMQTKADAVLEATDTELFAIPAAELTSWADPGFYEWSLFDPYMGSAQALVQSGNLGVVSDRELRQRLSVWAGLLVEKERYGFMVTNTLFMQHFPLVAQIEADGIWSPDERREFRVILGQTTFLADLVRQNHERLQATAQDILDYLGSQ